jgi:hypothetical protein
MNKNWRENTEQKIEVLGQELDDGSDQSDIIRLGTFIIEQLVRKNKNYGNSALTPPMLAPDVPPNSAILVRMSDKLKRIRELEKGNPDLVGESLADTYIDFGGYAILLALEALQRLEAVSSPIAVPIKAVDIPF